MALSLPCFVIPDLIRDDDESKTVTVGVFSFYLFAVVLLTSAVMVIVSRNPVHSVLWLIVAFFNAAGLFILLGAEFLAMILLIVYVGAVAVLFLFVVMMLDIDVAEMRAGFARYWPLGATLAVALAAEIIIAGKAWAAVKLPRRPRAATPRRSASSSTSTMCIRSRSRPSCCWSPSSRPLR